jgi:hypothetical protein
MAPRVWQRLTKGEDVLATAVTNASIPGVPAILLVVLGLLEPAAYGFMVPELVPNFLPFTVGPLVVYALWFASHHPGWNWASTVASIGSVALGVGGLFLVLIMFLGLFAFAYGQGPLAGYVILAAFLVAVATLASNFVLFAKLDRLHKRHGAPGDRAPDR